LPPNAQGIGARIRLIGGSITQSQEMICGGRYLSGDQAMRVFAADPDSKQTDAIGSQMAEWEPEQQSPTSRPTYL